MRVAVAAVVLGSVLWAPLPAQESPADSSGGGVAVEPTGVVEVAALYDTGRWHGERTRIALQVPESGARIAVLIDQLDVTGLFDRNGERLVFDARPLPLPRGESELVVFRIEDSGSWQEVGRFPLRVLGRLGLEQGSVEPKLDVANKGQVAAGAFPSAMRPPRAEFQDVTFSTGLQGTLQRSGWTTRMQANFVGVSNQQEALQFGGRQEDAPRFDISDYLIDARRSRGSLQVGHVSFGANRHLINGFASRGLTGGVQLGQFGSLGVAAMNGSSLVGWNNIFGFDDHRHRVMSTTLGLELLPGRPGGLRVEASALDGSLLPLASFTQGAVLDAERSSGYGVTVAASDPSQRVRGAVGVTRSRFVNPVDPTLTFGEDDVVPVTPETRTARWAELTAELLRQVTLPGSLNASLSAAWRHERVDPLFRSVASFSQADVEQNAWELTGAVGPLSTQLSHARSGDNLEGIPSVLTTLTRTSGVQVALPLSSVIPWRGRASLLPALTFGYLEAHQFGRQLPDEDEFQPSHVPDQLSINRTGGMQWQGARWRLGYTFGRSWQDNRQVGRELADFRAGSHVVSFGLTPLPSLDVTIDGGIERAENVEFDQELSTDRVGATANWRPFARTVLTFATSRTTQSDDPRTSETRSDELRVELSQGLNLVRGFGNGLPVQLFARFAEQRAVIDAVDVPSSSRRTWAVSTGLNLRMF